VDGLPDVVLQARAAAEGRPPPLAGRLSDGEVGLG